MTKFKFSIITINYNNFNGLKQTIESVLCQTYTNYEYIVIDGGSSDGSKIIIENFSDKIDYWVSEPDKGIYNAMNKGVSKATGEYCLFLNSGDVLHRNNVLEQIAAVGLETDLLIGKVRYLNTGQLSSLPDVLTMKHFYSHSLPHPSTFMKRTIFESLHYDESFRIVSDWKLFIEAVIMRNASYAFSDVVVTDFDTTGISATNKRLVDAERRKVLETMFPQRVLEDYVNFIEGDGYKTGYYDAFFIKLRSYKYGKVLYTMCVIIMKIIAFFKRSASFVNDFPLFLK
ncbi:MAG: glycosyltransferase [Bacteroidales bacterium]|nr:glycosyltransferase [Bacteroidaceae bacterium]MBO5106855.1 glycosyltransferase [Bacteroidales bacterium]